MQDLTKDEDRLLCTRTDEAVSGAQGSLEAEGRGCLRSQGRLCRVGYLVHSAGHTLYTVTSAQKSLH